MGRIFYTQEENSGMVCSNYWAINTGHERRLGLMGFYLASILLPNCWLDASRLEDGLICFGSC